MAATYTLGPGQRSSRSATSLGPSTAAGSPTLAHQGRRWADSAWTRGTSSSARGVQSHCGRRGRHLQLDAASWQTPWMGERIDPPMSRITSPEQVTLAWDGNLSTAGSWSATPEGRSGSRFFLSISATSHRSLTGSSLASALNAAGSSSGGPAIPWPAGCISSAIRARSSLVGAPSVISRAFLLHAARGSEVP